MAKKYQILLSIGLGIFLTGCMMQPPHTEKKSSLPSQASQEAQPPSANYPILREKDTSATTIYRKLPASCKAGIPFTVTLLIAVKPGTTGIIIEEILPDGWRVTTASSPWNKQEGTTWKWLRWGKELEESSLTYTVLPPKTSEKIVEWKGNAKTHKERMIPIFGDNKMMVIQ